MNDEDVELLKQVLELADELEKSRVGFESILDGAFESGRSSDAPRKTKALVADIVFDLRKLLFEIEKISRCVEEKKAVEKRKKKIFWRCFVGA